MIVSQLFCADLPVKNIFILQAIPAQQKIFTINLTRKRTDCGHDNSISADLMEIKAIIFI